MSPNTMSNTNEIVKLVKFSPKRETKRRQIISPISRRGRGRHGGVYVGCQEQMKKFDFFFGWVR